MRGCKLRQKVRDVDKGWGANGSAASFWGNSALKYFRNEAEIANPSPPEGQKYPYAPSLKWSYLLACREYLSMLGIHYYILMMLIRTIALSVSMNLHLMNLVCYSVNSRIKVNRLIKHLV